MLFLSSVVFATYFLVACGGNSNDALQNYIDEHGDALIARFFVGPDADIIRLEAASRNELLIIADIPEMGYHLLLADVMSSGYASIEDLFESGLQDEQLMLRLTGYMTRIANEVRDTTELNHVTVTFIFYGGDRELGRASFESE